MTEEKKAAIKGIGAVLTDEDGDVVAHAFDFDRSGYGGYKLWEAQRVRVRDAVYRHYISRYTYGPVAEVLSTYQSSENSQFASEQKETENEIHRHRTRRSSRTGSMIDC